MPDTERSIEKMANDYIEITLICQTSILADTYAFNRYSSLIIIDQDVFKYDRGRVLFFKLFAQNKSLKDFRSILQSDELD